MGFQNTTPCKSASTWRRNASGQGSASSPDSDDELVHEKHALGSQSRKVAGSRLFTLRGHEMGVFVLQVMMLIRNHPVPIIAMVNGLATAAGCQLVASCDIAVASDKSSFATPGVNVGLFCSTPAVALGRAVPRKVSELPFSALRLQN